MGFDVEQVKADLIAWLQNWFEENGPGCNAVIGISGGKDSSVTAALCVAGVLMPNGVQSDIQDAEHLVKHLGIRYHIINIKDAFDAFVNGVFFAGIQFSHQARVNLPPRLRMSLLYAVSQSENGRVINTCNLSEDWVGYSTRYGDSVGDVCPLGKLTVTEVKELGLSLGLPRELVFKVPSDGISGKTDEDNLGFTYAVLDRYIRTGEIDDPETKALIDRKHKANLFKLQLMQTFPYAGPELAQH